MVGNQFQSKMNDMGQTGMATATDGLCRHQWSVMSPLAHNLRRPPCRRPRLPGLLSSVPLPLPPLPSPLLPQPPPPPRPTQLPNLAPTSSAPFRLESRIHDEEPRSARRSSWYPRTICCRRMRPASAMRLASTRLRAVWISSDVSSGPCKRYLLVHCQSSSGSCVGAGVIWAALHRYRVVGHDS